MGGMSTPTEPPAPSAAKAEGLKLPPKLARLVEAYGRVAIGVFLVLWLASVVGAVAAVWLGLDLHTLSGAASRFGLGEVKEIPEAAGFMVKLGAAWGLTRLTFPLRIGGTLLLTPLVAKLL